VAAHDLGRDGEARGPSPLGGAPLEGLEQMLARLGGQAGPVSVTKIHQASSSSSADSPISPGWPLAAMACRALRTRFRITR
jgi:hypothetical protein